MDEGRQYREAIVGDGSILTPITEADRLDLQCARQCLGVLERHYPGYYWFVEVDAGKGLIAVRNLDLSGERGYNLHLKGHASASELELLIKRAGGEILERYHQPRGTVDQVKLAEADRDFAGRKVFDA